MDDRLVQNRACPECGKPQSRKQGSDGKFKRWTRCDCPPKTKSGEAGRNVRPSPGSSFGRGKSLSDDQVASPPVSGYLHRDTVQRLDKR